MRKFGAAKAALAACGLSIATIGIAAAPGPANPYAKLAPVDAYLMDRAGEIALAKSAAPASIAKDATVLVLTRTGYETVTTGTNGFVCYVARGFATPFDLPEHLNPKIRAAACDNPQAARTIVPLVKLRTGMALAGRSEAETVARIKAAFRSGEIPPLPAGAMCYMMSKSSYLGDSGSHDLAHVMFYVPLKDGTDWGANVKGSPVMGVNYWYFMPGDEAKASGLPPMAVLVVGTRHWSDGSPATQAM